MVATSRPSSARRAGEVTVLRASKSQPNFPGPRITLSGRPASAGDNAAQSFQAACRSNSGARRSGGKLAGEKVLNWFRLPATGGWVPTARAGHTAVTVGSDIVMFGGTVAGQRVNEVARFDLNTRKWHRLPRDSTRSASKARGDGGLATTLPPSSHSIPKPRALHVSWSHGTDVYIHGGEGPAGTPISSDEDASGAFGGSVFEDVLGGVGRDPFAEEDGGTPLRQGRVKSGIEVMVPENSGHDDDLTEHRRALSQRHQKHEHKLRGPTVSILEDIWKLDTRTLQWTRLASRLAPLGRKGHTATVAPLRGRERVFIFGGAPAGRRGLSNALYSVEISRLSKGEGIWERHRPCGSPPVARQSHSFTAVGGGKKLVLFGGMTETGELLRDVQILEIDGGQPSWAQLQSPVGDVPTARHGHSATAVPASACSAVGVSSRFGDVLVFGGEGRLENEEDIRPTDSHEIFLYDLQASRWHTNDTGHAFPIGRHNHSMAAVVGWTPPAFRPDGTLAEPPEGAPPSTQGMSQYHPRVGIEARIPSETAIHQWGKIPPTCAVIFGGLNSMYVSPEMWILPLRWREKTVQLSPPPPESVENPLFSSLGFASAGVITAGMATCARDARARVTQTGKKAVHFRNRKMDHSNENGGSSGEDASWRLWSGDPSGGGSTSVNGERVTAHGSGAQNEKRHRRASLPAAASAGLGTRLNKPPLQWARDEDAFRVNDARGNGGGGGDTESERINCYVGMKAASSAVEDMEWTNLNGKLERSSSEEVDFSRDAGVILPSFDVTSGTFKKITVELLRLRKVAFVAENKLSSEVITRMSLEETNKKLTREIVALQTAGTTAEAQLCDDIKQQWREGQRTKARCISLERLLAEAYELINLSELQHHLQIKLLMPQVYGDPNKTTTTNPSEAAAAESLQESTTLERSTRNPPQVHKHLMYTGTSNNNNSAKLADYPDRQRALYCTTSRTKSVDGGGGGGIDRGSKISSSSENRDGSHQQQQHRSLVSAVRDRNATEIIRVCSGNGDGVVPQRESQLPEAMHTFALDKSGSLSAHKKAGLSRGLCSYLDPGGVV